MLEVQIRLAVFPHAFVHLSSYRMSRAVQRNGASDKPLDGNGELQDHFASMKLRNINTDADEECPICHTKRYLHQGMRFLLNPECYHKMCMSCVDRIFAHGPAPCPVAGCRKTLRKNKFRAPRFEDLALEREVDIRRRVSEVLVVHIATSDKY